MTRLARIGLGVAMVAFGSVMAFGKGTAVEAQQHPDPVVSISPAQQTVATGDTVTLQVSVAGAFNMSSYEIELIYDPLIVAFSSAANGTFVTQAQAPTLLCQPALDRDANQPGNVHPGMRRATFGCTTQGASPTVEGSGLLMTFTFTAAGGGTMAFIPSKYDLLTPLSLPICEQDGPPHIPQPPTPTPTPLPALCNVVPPQASVTVNGPALPTPTVDPNATPASSSADFRTPTAASGGSGASAQGGSAAGSSTDGGASGVTAGEDTQPGGGGVGGLGGVGGVQSSSTGASGARTQSGSNTGVGRFGSGPDSYARGSDNFRTQQTVLAVAGAALVATGLSWRRMRRRSVRHGAGSARRG